MTTRRHINLVAALTVALAVASCGNQTAADQNQWAEDYCQILSEQKPTIGEHDNPTGPDLDYRQRILDLGPPPGVNPETLAAWDQSIAILTSPPSINDGLRGWSITSALGTWELDFTYAQDDFEDLAAEQIPTLRWQYSDIGQKVWREEPGPYCGTVFSVGFDAPP